MRCRRCQSPMILDYPFRYTDLTGSEASYSDLYRCLFCGHYEDKTMQLNRLKQLTEVK